MEQEPDATGRVVSCATVFLTNRECPWRCLMCDLWQHTLTESVPAGAIPAQIEFALRSLGPAEHIKLYNSGSFFDPRAVPPADHPLIARQVGHFARVVTECHPALVNESAVRFRDQLEGTLEIAIGLETVHAATLEKLNKRMTLEQFADAAAFLRSHAIALRVFLLVQPPFIPDAAQALHWTQQSIEFAFNCGATVVSLIPTRAGNGALEALARDGQFVPPTLATLEAALALGLKDGRGRVFADVWDLERFSKCTACFPARRERLTRINLQQRMEPDVACAVCGESRSQQSPA